MSATKKEKTDGVVLSRQCQPLLQKERAVESPSGKPQEKALLECYSARVAVLDSVRNRHVT